MPSIVVKQDKTLYPLEKEKETCNSVLLTNGGDWFQRLNTGSPKHHLTSQKTCDDDSGDKFVKILAAQRQQATVVMDENWLHLTSLVSEHILVHLDDMVVVEPLCQELWNLGKRLKQDNLMTMGKNASQYGQQQDVYSKAIQVIIYHCRGSIHYSQRDWAHVINDCRKCLAIDLQTNMLMSSDSLLLQKVGLIKEHASSMLEQGLQYQRRCLTGGSSSSIASSSTGSSSEMMMVCSFCSLEKRKMPVCAQCKHQAYCGIKCLKQDKTRHISQCQRR
ncbi:hypothetical protein BCR42DRAFT_425768 [Absidia repens]|uniref:MYND-type domain-containing protein n=1 Tax=Absidia repens TaxID=90262 RepID=A0A1X2I235_9FUNG|nr:hypothetical protein BCR42DRAFT_425768 [Absidia repens]